LTIIGRPHDPRASCAKGEHQNCIVKRRWQALVDQTWTWNFSKALSMTWNFSKALSIAICCRQSTITAHVSCAAYDQTRHSFDILSKAAHK
jgi:hypothetical protein